MTTQTARSAARRPRRDGAPTSVSGSTPASRDPFGLPVEVRLRSGERRRAQLSARGHCELWVEALHSGLAGLIEVVLASRGPDGALRMRRQDPERFREAGDRAGVWALARESNDRGLEAFCTPATLARAAAGNGAVGELGSVWVDIDESAGAERLRAFPRRPHMVVASGGSGGVHAYWRLAVPVSPGDGEAANRALAVALGGDPQSTNRGRIMRLPGTLNRKRRRVAACRVVMCDLARPGYELDELCAGLSDPRRDGGSRRGSGPGAVGDDHCRTIPAGVYFERLAGTAVPRSGLVSCPAPDHPDRHPSCSVSGTVWWCFACGRGGSIYDLASVLEGGPVGTALRGEEFRRARELVAAAFGEPPPKQSGRR